MKTNYRLSQEVFKIFYKKEKDFSFKIKLFFGIIYFVLQNHKKKVENMEGFSIPLEIGGAFLVGMALGYFFKKAFKITLFFSGAIVALLIYLEYKGIITINKEALEHIAKGGSDILKGAYIFIKNWLIDFKTASAGVGFIAGLKIG